ncbi:hypothetical protein Fmac_018841 [Flemingia macrophylla]|uniref:Uncharacterized protein n=1 Tax=Flemingia macrophylla TaxID=520843 RepID=A0ABD1M621_9FABA
MHENLLEKEILIIRTESTSYFPFWMHSQETVLLKLGRNLVYLISRTSNGSSNVYIIPTFTKNRKQGIKLI